MIKHYLVVDDSAHSAEIWTKEENDMWTSENPSGWTEQDLTGAHGRIVGYGFDTHEEAEREMVEYLKCDSVETGIYCYSHNPQPTGRIGS